MLKETQLLSYLCTSSTLDLYTFLCFQRFENLINYLFSVSLSGVSALKTVDPLHPEHPGSFTPS